jgi:hypothetical protein
MVVRSAKEKTGLSNELDWAGRRGAVPSRYWHLPHVEPGLRPMTWPKASGSRTTRITRRAGRRSCATPPVAPQTALPPADVVAEPFATEPRCASQWADVGTSRNRAGSVDVARIAAGAIAEADGGYTRSGPFGPPPQQIAMAPSGDDFVAPPLPEGMSVLGANVVAFALSTDHAVGERVYPRFPLRLGRPEVRCSDFRTTDLAQDWFLTNGGPDRDRAGLDPDGDGFACNWTPDRYRDEARAATQPPAATPSAAPGRVSLSPNHGPRRDGLRPELVVLHYTAMSDAGPLNARSAIRRARCPATG